MKFNFTSFYRVDQRFFSIINLLLSLVILGGCDKNKENVAPKNIAVEFNTASATLMKSTGSNHPAKITLSFSEPLLASSIITLNVSSVLEPGIDYNIVSDFCQEKECNIEIEKGEKSIVFEVYSINNENKKGNHDIVFQITKASNGITIPSEAITEFTLTLMDDEVNEVPTKTAISFDKESDTLGENAWPEYASVMITFSQELPAPGFIKIKEITTLRWGYEYDTFYGSLFTAPQCKDGYACEVIINLDKGEKEVSGIEIFAFDDDEANGNRDVIFQIIEVSEGIEMPVGEASAFTLTVIDDE